MKIVTAKKMQDIDRKAIKRYGIPGIILMEHAAIITASYVQQMLRPGKNKVAIFCGQGNNGGDGFACARNLINRGFKVSVYFVGKRGKLSSEANANYNILRKMRQKILRPDVSFLKKKLRDIDLIIDALLGIGLKNKPRIAYVRVIEMINNSQKTVLSLDVPSGLDATTGKVPSIAVCANTTITFGLFKKGLLNSQAKNYTGKVVIADIGLPRNLLC